MLRIDLTSSTVDTGQVPEKYIRDFIGGSGLGARLLWDSLRPELDPLDPRNPLLWVNGPLTGTGGPTTGRFTICARSPQTGLWGEANFGGFVGPELRFAGVDVLWISGRASQPVYLWIHDGQAEIRPAGHLWGRSDVYETQRLIRAELEAPQAKIACVGLAAEHGVPFAGIFSDHGRAAARTGMGALMASKNLKAVAVRGARGAGSLPLANADRYRGLRLAANKALLDETLTTVFRQTGTSGSAEYFQLLGDMPQKYWTQAAFAGVEKISGSAMADTILTGTSACQGCVISCGRVITVPGGPYATQGPAKGPEYETICSFGSQLLIDDLPAIAALGSLCDRLGMDTISAGGVLGLATLLYEHGLLTKADTGGLELAWGDPRPYFTLLEQMARREGIGDLLAQGSLALASACGVPELAAQVGNLEVPMHDPRGATGMGLVYVTSPRGACHNQSDYFMVEIGSSIEELGIPMTDRSVDAGKAVFVARHQDFRTVCNSLVVCIFALVPPSTLAELLGAASGQAWSLEEMLRAGERAWNLKRLFNLRLGWTPDKEKLPNLLLKPLPDGGQAGVAPDMDLLLGEYYAARGWDRSTGGPTPQKVAQLGLEWTVD